MKKWDSNGPINEKSETGMMASFYAVSSNNTEVIQILLDHGAEIKTDAMIKKGDIEEKFISNYTPLHHGLIRGADSACQFLITQLRSGLVLEKGDKGVRYLSPTYLNRDDKSKIEPESSIVDATALAIAVIKNPTMATYILDHVMHSAARRA